MLYPAELQALPQPRSVTVTQGFSSCLGLSRLSGLFGLSRVFGLETNQINQRDQTDRVCLCLAV